MVFIETNVLRKQLEDLYGDHLIDAESYRAFQNGLIDETVHAVTVRGTGGVQKARWKTLGGGKSGGLRVIFYHLNETDRYLLLPIYKKGRQDTLSAEQKSKLKLTFSASSRQGPKRGPS